MTDLDIALPCYIQLLNRIHSEFFTLLEKTGEANVKDIVRSCRKQVFKKEYVALFELLFRNQDQPMKSKAQLKMTYEGNKCLQSGLEFEDVFTGDSSKEYIYLMPDKLSEKDKTDIDSLKSAFPTFNLHFLSIYWFYLSTLFGLELDMKAFSTFNTEKVSEKKRVQQLLMAQLKS